MKEFGIWWGGGGGGGGGGKRKKGRESIKINCSSAFYKVVANNKILKAVESPFQ